MLEHLFINFRYLYNDWLQEKSATSVALGEDVELLGNAFEDLQEQNMRLQQQLKEKDDANFKLMSERIKVGLQYAIRKSYR